MICLCSYLLRTKTLDTLNLSNNKISSNGAFAISIVIKENSRLKKLILGMNNIDDLNAARIVKSIGHNNMLVELDLSNNMLGEATAHALDFSLRNNSVIEKLDFSYSNFTMISGLLDQIISHPKLICLELSFTKILDEEVRQIQKELIRKEVKNNRGLQS